MSYFVCSLMSLWFLACLNHTKYHNNKVKAYRFRRHKHRAIYTLYSHRTLIKHSRRWNVYCEIVLCAALFFFFFLYYINHQYSNSARVTDTYSQSAEVRNCRAKTTLLCRLCNSISAYTHTRIRQQSLTLSTNDASAVVFHLSSFTSSFFTTICFSLAHSNQ